MHFFTLWCAQQLVRATLSGASLSPTLARFTETSIMIRRGHTLAKSCQDFKHDPSAPQLRSVKIRRHLAKIPSSIMNGLSFGTVVLPFYQCLTLSSFSNQTEHENIRFYIDCNVIQKQYTFDPSAPSHSLRMKLHSFRVTSFNQGSFTIERLRSSVQFTPCALFNSQTASQYSWLGRMCR